MSVVNTVIFTPPIESKNVSSFLWTGADGKGGERRLRLKLYVGERGGGGRETKGRGLTPPKVLSKSGEARVKNPVCLICFSDSVDDNAVGVGT